eukprot:scaffold14537_cov45-Cyclotella_meneghiniana.AAC.1
MLRWLSRFRMAHYANTTQHDMPNCHHGVPPQQLIHAHTPSIPTMASLHIVSTAFGLQLQHYDTANKSRACGASSKCFGLRRGSSSVSARLPFASSAPLCSLTGCWKKTVPTAITSPEGIMCSAFVPSTATARLSPLSRSARLLHADAAKISGLWLWRLKLPLTGNSQKQVEGVRTRKGEVSETPDF